MTMKQPRIGYVPYSSSLDRPGDRRRFVAYAHARNIKFEIAQPEEQYDFVILSEVADISVWCDYPHGKIIFDFIDSYLTIPRTNLKQWLRGVVFFMARRHRRLRFDYWANLQKMCNRADAVVCTTEEQKVKIQEYCNNVHIVHDVHSSVVRTIKGDYECGEPFNLVWEGLPSNITQLKQIQNVLRDIHEHRPIVLNVITDPEHAGILGRFSKVKSIDLLKKIFSSVKFHIWDESTCSDIICNSDLAVIPIDLSDQFVTGKPRNKLLLLWRMGMPVITSATPDYMRAMKEAGCADLACKGEDEWFATIKRMMNDEDARRKAGEQGKIYAEKYYGEKILLERWDAVFSSLGFSFKD